jgi:ABC-type glycerol-3-phosphate transport system substrate-binding protein
MVFHLKRTRAAAVAVAVTSIILTAACSSDSGKSDASKPYNGQTVTIEAYSAVPEFDFYKSQMSAFTQKTGIKVNWVSLPVAAMDQKIPLQLKAKDSKLDVFFTGSEKITDFVGSGGVEKLEPYIKDTKKTPSSYNFADFAPEVEAACQSKDQTFCIATHTGGALLYYNTKMFKEAGIEAPPKTPQELLDVAKKLTTKEHAGFCARGDKSQALYDAFQMWNWFVKWDNPVTGTYFDKNWNFTLGTEPQASAFGNFYRDLMQNTAPKGIATYLVTNCLQDFQQGRVAMWHDDSGTIPSVLDPAQSKVADSTAFAAMPCPPANPDHCQLVQPFGIWMNKASAHKGAAWQLMQFITSKDMQVKAVKGKALLTPSRVSVLKDPGTVAALPKTFPEALTYILAHPDVALLPFIPEGVSLIPPIANGLSDLITSDKPVPEIMGTMKGGVDTIMKKAGYPKPFPSS